MASRTFDGLLTTLILFVDSFFKKHFSFHEFKQVSIFLKEVESLTS